MVNALKYFSTNSVQFKLTPLTRQGFVKQGKAPATFVILDPISNLKEDLLKVKTFHSCLAKYIELYF